MSSPARTQRALRSDPGPRPGPAANGAAQAEDGPDAAAGSDAGRDAPLLAATGITKRFGGVTAVSDVDIVLMPGAVHAVVGENGAGKSTLMKILDGVIAPDDGTISVPGLDSNAPSASRRAGAGIGMVPQELELFGELTVAENLFVGRDRPRTRWLGFDWRSMNRTAEELIGSLGATLDVTVPVKQLSVANQQLVEIARALLRDARILIMDEPTASLSDREISQLFEIIRALTKRGVGILYISHRLDEIFAIADHITVLRDGRKVASGPRSEFTHDSLVHNMIGRPLSTLYTRHKGAPGAVALDVRGLTRAGEFSDISFELRKGEIVGLAGLIGAGRTEVAQTIYGLRPAQDGEIRLGDRRVTIDSPETALGLGIAYVPEERRSQGNIPEFSVARNITFSSLDRLPGRLFVDRRAEDAFADRFVKALGIRCADSSDLIGRLSGGNQQKVIVARSLAREPDVLILDEPTRGVDIGAKAELYRLIDDLAKSGKAILLISSEIPELLAMSDRILVMHEGDLVAELSGEAATQERVGAAAAGLVKDEEVGR
jgi:rhamnose transport system ATP-binding protein